MKKFVKDYLYLILGMLMSFVVFYPSLFAFFTNDDFYFLKISRAFSFVQFLDFFNPIKNSAGFGMYRPLSTQAYYFISWKFFNSQPYFLHIISFLIFFGIVLLVYRLGFSVTNSKKAGSIAAFIYAISATHFGNLYYLAAFQELAMTFFVLLSCLGFMKKKYWLSYVFFLLALCSKETAVVAPFLLSICYVAKLNTAKKKLDIKELLLKLLPFILTIAVYLFIRFRWYGIASGDSYIWDFSPKKFVNTIFWYALWSLNLPESLIDYIGPGIKVNATLFLYWKDQIIPILIAFFAEGILLALILFRSFTKALDKNLDNSMSAFSITWFVASLLPVAFLPLHKFSFYLTLPLVGIAIRIGYLLTETKTRELFIILFLAVWTITAVLTLKFTVQTNWITQSEKVSKNAYVFFNNNSKRMQGTNIYFVDTVQDLTLPWSPTQTLKTILSDKNFFDVYFPSFTGGVKYVGLVGTISDKNGFVVTSDKILGY